jgi:hypothetical protein
VSGTFAPALKVVLASVLGQLAVTPSGWPVNARNYVVPGLLAWDECECGLLAVEWQTASYTGIFPNPTQPLADGCKPFLALQLQVTALRCAPNPGPNGSAPAPAALQDAADVNLDDLEAVLTGTSKGVELLYNTNTILQYALGTAQPTGPQGGCVGVTQQLFLGFSNKWGPC